MIDTFSTEVAEFDNTMKTVIKNENERMEREEDMKEKIRQNGGKNLNFF